MSSASSFSSLNIYNSLNSAFTKYSIKGQVISTISLSRQGNITVSTTPDFNSDFLIKYKAIIKGVFPLLVELKKEEA